jgi:hypothetical protein
MTIFMTSSQDTHTLMRRQGVDLARVRIALSTYDELLSAHQLLWLIVVNGESRWPWAHCIVSMEIL